MATTVAGITGESGNASDLLFAPFGIAFDYSNALYVADSYNNRVQKYSIGNLLGITVAGKEDGSTNITSDYLKFPSDVVIDSNGSVYVTDTFNYRIPLWTIGASSGVIIAGTGKYNDYNNRINLFLYA